jgi:hypothetical protein
MYNQVGNRTNQPFVGLVQDEEPSYLELFENVISHLISNTQFSFNFAQKAALEYRTVIYAGIKDDKRLQNQWKKANDKARLKVGGTETLHSIRQFLNKRWFGRRTFLDDLETLLSQIKLYKIREAVSQYKSNLEQEVEAGNAEDTTDSQADKLSVCSDSTSGDNGKHSYLDNDTIPSPELSSSNDLLLEADQTTPISTEPTSSTPFSDTNSDMGSDRSDDFSKQFSFSGPGSSSASSDESPSVESNEHETSQESDRKKIVSEDKQKPLEDVISAIDDYLTYNKKHCRFSIRHRHGTTGIKRAESLKVELENLIDKDNANKEGLIQKIKQHIESSGGNNHPHSLKTYLSNYLNRLSNPGSALTFCPHIQPPEKQTGLSLDGNSPCRVPY